MLPFLLVVAWLIALGSLPFISQATIGVAGICFACFIGITIRLIQADRQQDELMNRRPGEEQAGDSSGILNP